MLSGKRSLVVVYLLWFVAGPIGAHRLYLLRYGSALALVVLILVCGTISFILMNEAASCQSLSGCSWTCSSSLGSSLKARARAADVVQLGCQTERIAFHPLPPFRRVPSSVRGTWMNGSSQELLFRT